MSMRAWFAAPATRLGRRGTLLCATAAALGSAGFIWGAFGPTSGRAWGALIACWLFFSGLGMGAMALQAALRITGARWAESIQPLTRVALPFIPVAALTLVVLVAGVPAWAPWWQHVDPAKTFWLNVPCFAMRELGGSGVLFWLAWRMARQSDENQLTMPLAVGYCLVYAAVLSMWAFDFVLALDLEWVSTLIGGHFFMGAFLSGVAFVALLGTLTGAAVESQRHDLGKLCFGLAAFWAYLLWSQYLPIWFGNLPEEIGFVLRRSEGPWRFVSLAVIGLTFVAPFAGLFQERAKRSAATLRGLAFAILGGVWLERYLLVMPSLTAPGDPVATFLDVLIATGFLGLFVLCCAFADLPRKPAPTATA